MSDANRPDEPEEQNPPYPGWSPQQPPATGGWGQPGQQPWSQPGGGWGQPGVAPGQSKGEPQGPPAGPPPPGQPGDQPGQAPPGWQHGAWNWRLPDVKPGVIPLRPLGVGEILDGAVTTIRKNLGAMLGLSAVVAVVTQLVNLAVIWSVYDDYTQAMSMSVSPTASPEQVFDSLGTTLSASLISVGITMLATVFLTGMLTVVVGRAALGEHIAVAQAWRMAKGRLMHLLGLTILYTLIWALTPVVFVLLAFAAGPVAIAGVLGAIPLAIWLYVKFALATPALMLETTNQSGQPRPVGIIDSLRRSSRLVTGAWWRTFGLLILTFIIAQIVTAAIAVPFSVTTAFGSDDLLDPSMADLTIQSLGGIIATTITAPFIAAATALIYIDRRIRREALDLELARAAGVEIPRQQPPGP